MVSNLVNVHLLLQVKRGLPLQDLTGRRGLPDDPRMQANAEMQVTDGLTT